MDVMVLQKKLEGLALPFCNLRELPPPPAGSYAAVKVVGNLAYVSGQMSVVSKGKLYPFLEEVTEKDEVKIGYLASEIAMLNVLLQLTHNQEIKEVKGIVKIEGYFKTTNANYLPKMLDGASTLVGQLFSKSDHARTVFGVSQLPYNSVVELSVIAEVEV